MTTPTFLDPAELDAFRTPLRLPGRTGPLALVDANAGPLVLDAQLQPMSIQGSAPTQLWAYRLSSRQGAAINPTVVVRRGTDLVADVTNLLDEATTTHWHGLHVDWRMDGHPLNSINPGVTFAYEFRVADRAGTYWYHPHPHGHTANQVYRGLAGFLLVVDDDDVALREALDLNLGGTDLPIMLQDKTFNDEGGLVYADDPAAAVMGYEGETILANLTVKPVLRVATRVYRLRLLNGSNARVYRLALVDHTTVQLPFVVIGTDGGLLDEPQQVAEVFLSPGERVDLLIDLRHSSVGDIFAVASLGFDPMHHEEMPDTGTHGMDTMHMHRPAAGPASGEPFYILKLAVTEQCAYNRRLPDRLAPLPTPPLAATTRSFTLSLDSGATDDAPQWMINGRTYSLDDYPVTPARGATEIWQIHNEHASMPHPMHLHGRAFRVLQRVGSPAQIAQLALDGHGRTATDLGRKDTVLVWPGETVHITTSFAHSHPDEQLYLFHCHILEHEDAGMMLNVKVPGATALC